MCLYSKTMINKRYTPTKKNGWGLFMEECKDPRKLYVSYGCGKCIECVTQRRNSWIIRLTEELKEHDTSYFVTLTFNNKSLRELYKDADAKDANTIAKLAVRRFLERWRKKYKKSVRHWLITELGDERQRIHLHGILFTDVDIETIRNIWKYGFIRVGEYCNEKSIGYITKYMLKGGSEEHEDFKGIVLTSPGIGKGYLKSSNAKRHKYNKGEKIAPYIDGRGFERSLPLYYRNKLLTDKEKDEAFTDYLDRETISIMGIEFDLSTDEGREAYMKRRAWERKRALQKGYKDDKFKEKNYPPSKDFIK